MLKDTINSLIMASMKARDKERTTTLQLIKSEIQKIETSGQKQDYTEAVEINMLKKMVKQRQEAIDMYVAAGRKELADAEQTQINVISEFLPAEASEVDICNVIDELIAGGVEPVKANMGSLIKGVKAKLSNADGKLVSQLVQKYLQK